MLGKKICGLAVAVATLLAGCGNSASVLAPVVSGSSGGSSSGGVVTPPPVAGKVGHVFILILENEDYNTSFGASSPAPYLSKTLPAMGQLLTQYYGTGHLSLDNYITMISGQAPSKLAQSDCQRFTDWVGPNSVDANGQATGDGCVYPPAAKTIADQLQAAGHSWKGYMEDMGLDLARDGRATCSHPSVTTFPGTSDPTQSATATDAYATRHNPFMYFHSIIDNQANCDAHVVALPNLVTDLQLIGTTPEYVFITPSLCHDGHDTPCVSGEPGGLASADLFLQTWVPRIVNSAAFKKDGLLIVTFDEASTSDTTACCSEPMGSTRPGITGPGGGRVGAVLVSPFIKPGTMNATPYNHYSLLKSSENVFGLPYLGYANAPGLAAFGADVFNGP